jgi:hypothetical protein
MRLYEFEKLNIGNWNENYCDLDILDGEQWSLECKYFNKKHKKVEGSNAYPLNWEEFANLINKLYTF